MLFFCKYTGGFRLSKRGFCLVGCAVGPAFRFENFELAKKEELLKLYPQHKALIERMCKE